MRHYRYLINVRYMHSFPTKKQFSDFSMKGFRSKGQFHFMVSGSERTYTFLVLLTALPTLGTLVGILSKI